MTDCGMGGGNYMSTMVAYKYYCRYQSKLLETPRPSGTDTGVEAPPAKSDKGTPPHTHTHTDTIGFAQ